MLKRFFGAPAKLSISVGCVQDWALLQKDLVTYATILRSGAGAAFQQKNWEVAHVDNIVQCVSQMCSAGTGLPDPCTHYRISYCNMSPGLIKTNSVIPRKMPWLNQVDILGGIWASPHLDSGIKASSEILHKLSLWPPPVEKVGSADLPTCSFVFVGGPR